MSQSGIDGLRILLGFELRLIDPDQLFSLARLLAETVVADPIKPGGEFRFAPKTPNVFVSAEKRLLGEIVCQSEIAAGELAEEAADGRLMITHEFGKGVVIIFNKNPRDKISIIERHLISLHLRGSVFAPHVQSPDEEITETDKERDNAKAPGTALPVVYRAEKHH